MNLIIKHSSYNKYIHLCNELSRIQARIYQLDKFTYSLFMYALHIIYFIYCILYNYIYSNLVTDSSRSLETQKSRIYPVLTVHPTVSFFSHKIFRNSNMIISTINNNQEVCVQDRNVHRRSLLLIYTLQSICIYIYRFLCPPHQLT